MRIEVKHLEALVEHWNGQRNFLIHPELFEFNKEFPPAEEVVDILRKDKNARVTIPGDLKDDEKEQLAQEFRDLPIEKVIDRPFNLAHFHLQNFYGPGQFLNDFQEKVMVPWRTFLSSAGFTWQRCYPIIFISGRNCSSSYHMDTSHVVAWQISGVKTFNGYKNPRDYASLDDAVNNRDALRSVNGPPDHNPDDVLSYRMEKGDLLWNQLLTPHWVPAGDEVAVSVNISHGGISQGGDFSPNETALRKRWEDHPKEAWLVDTRY
jgi:hypothetical protein